MPQPNAKRYVCDCEAVYPSVDDLHRCAARNHGRLNPRRLCGVLVSEGRYCLLLENHSGRCRPINVDRALQFLITRASEPDPLP